MEGTVEILENWVEESFLVQQDELALLNSMYSAAELRFISGFSLEEFSRIIESRIFNGVSDLSEAQVLMPHFNTVEFSLKIPIVSLSHC